MRGDVQMAPSSRYTLDASISGSASFSISGDLGNGAGAEPGPFPHQIMHEALLTRSILCAGPSSDGWLGIPDPGSALWIRRR